LTLLGEHNLLDSKLSVDIKSEVGHEIIKTLQKQVIQCVQIWQSFSDFRLTKFVAEITVPNVIGRFSANTYSTANPAIGGG